MLAIWWADLGLDMTGFAAWGKKKKKQQCFNNIRIFDAQTWKTDIKLIPSNQRCVNVPQVVKEC